MDKIMTDRELKDALVNILDDFVSYCKKYNLCYMLDGGTLLGAIRHKGFIPWDDDIDIAMPRPDYDRLHELIKQYPLPSRYRLESITANNSPYPFVKIVDTSTMIVNSNSSLHTSLWIDVFPLDGYPEYSDEERLNIKNKLNHYAFLLENACCSYGSGKNKFRAFFKAFVIFFARIRGAYYYGKKMDELVRNNTIQGNPYIGDCVWGGLRVRNGMRKEEMLDLIDIEFEGKLYKGTRFFDKYLCGLYGKYMELPPIEKRINHHTKAKHL